MGSYNYLSRKLLLKKAISDLSCYVRPIFKYNGVCGSFRALNYHSITDTFSEKDIYAQMTTPKEAFASQLKFLNEHEYNVLSCNDAVIALMADGVVPPKSVCITFDDGFKDNLKNGLPLLERYGFKATVFLTIDYIDKNGEYLNWDDVKLLLKTGLVSFGAHTLSHRKLSDLDMDAQEREIALSKKIMEDKLGIGVDLFAYPFGSYGSFDARTGSILETAGYKAAFTTIAGINTQKTSPFTLKRTRISWYDDDREFAKELAGDYDWYRIWQMMAREA